MFYSFALDWVGSKEGERTNTLKIVNVIHDIVLNDGKRVIDKGGKDSKNVEGVSYVQFIRKMDAAFAVS